MVLAIKGLYNCILVARSALGTVVISMLFGVNWQWVSCLRVYIKTTRLFEDMCVNAQWTPTLFEATIHLLLDQLKAIHGTSRCL